ncbi:MAG: hypothetical protein ACHP9S_08375 [Terriglobales bacterium]|jgi:hypothetical protein
MNAQFLDLHAAADFLGPGAVEVSRYQSEITDIVRRRGVFGQRVKQVPATGHPSRFFEQTAINSPAAANAFVDPRNIVATVGSPTRVERSVPLKALVSQINYNLFDLEVGQQQSQFAFLQAKDLADSVDGLMRTHDVALWNGNDTSLSAPTTLQYYGAAGQIAGGGNLGTVHRTDPSIVDGLKAIIAGMVSNSSYEVRPTAIYANPVLLDLIDREMKAQFNVVLSTTEIAGGLRVKTLSTQAGDLPLVPEWSLGYTGTPGTDAVFPAYIVSEDMIEYHWLTDPNPRVFQLGLSGSLAQQMVVVKFGAIVVKGAGYAHYKVNVER